MRITFRTFKMYMYYGTDSENGKGNFAEFVLATRQVLLGVWYDRMPYYRVWRDSNEPDFSAGAFRMSCSRVRFAMGRLKLSPVCPDLDDVMSSASSEGRIRAGWIAAQWAISHVGLSHPAISAARIGGSTDAIKSLVSELDDLYLDLQESVDAGKSTREEMMTAFRRARAANAIEFAVRGDAYDAVYEAGFCADDVSGLRHAVASALREEEP